MNGWCTSLFALLDSSHATDTAIRDAVDAYLADRRKSRERAWTPDTIDASFDPDAIESDSSEWESDY